MKIEYSHAAFYHSLSLVPLTPKATFAKALLRWIVVHLMIPGNWALKIPVPLVSWFQRDSMESPRGQWGLDGWWPGKKGRFASPLPQPCGNPSSENTFNHIGSTWSLEVINTIALLGSISWQWQGLSFPINDFKIEFVKVLQISKTLSHWVMKLRGE